MRLTVMNFLLLILSALAATVKTVKYWKNCDRNQSCSFLSKDLGWELYRQPNNLAGVHPPISDSWKSGTSTIFMTMASYRDDLCPITLYNLYTKAAHPEVITVGVIQQNVKGDMDCLEEYCRMMSHNSSIIGQNNGQGCPFLSNIKIMRLDASEAKGPTWARSKAATLMKDEEFCLQTDSHMDFVPNWDMKMKQMWGLINNEYAVLSTYVSDLTTLPYQLDGKKGVNGVFESPHLCMVRFSGSHGMIRNWGTKCIRNLPEPKLTNIVWGAGLSFSKCHAERKATYDPHTPFIFDGEEFSRGLRFWTWGYDIYTPHRVYIVHNYHRSQADPKHMQWMTNVHKSLSKRKEKTETIQSSVRRLKMLFDMPHPNADPKETLKMQQSRYGLGDRRSLDQAIKFSGIDTKNRKMIGNKCGNLDYVPFKEHPWGPNYIPQYDPVTEEFKDVRDPGSIYYNPKVMKKAWVEADKNHRIKHNLPSRKREKKSLVNSSINEETTAAEQLKKHIESKTEGTDDVPDDDEHALVQRDDEVEVHFKVGEANGRPVSIAIEDADNHSAVEDISNGFLVLLVSSMLICCLLFAFMLSSMGFKMAFGKKNFTGLGRLHWG